MARTDDELRAVLRKHEPHYRETMGAVPESIAQMAELAPAVFDGYSQLRTWILRPDGDLPRKYKHLIFSVLDCSIGNQGGAINHIRAGMRAGLTVGEVAEAMLQLLITNGTPAWGKTGRHVVVAAQEYQRELDAHAESGRG